MLAAMVKHTEPLLRTSEAARILEVASDTVRKMVKAGHLEPDARTVSGEILFFEATIRVHKTKREKERREGKRRGRPPMSIQTKKGSSKTNK